MTCKNIDKIAQKLLKKNLTNPFTIRLEFRTFELVRFGADVHNGFDQIQKKQAATYIFGTQNPYFRFFKHKMEEYIMKNEVTYTEINGINYPNLS